MMSEIDDLKNSHPKIQQFVRDVDAVYVKIWERFQIRTHLPRCEIFPNSKFLDLFNRCHCHLTTYLNVYCNNHDLDEILFPCAISIHEFMNGVECKVSIPPTEFDQIRPYRSEEMQPFIANIVCWYWFRSQNSPFDLQWVSKISFVDRFWQKAPEYSWMMTQTPWEKTPLTSMKQAQLFLDFYKLMQYFFGDAFRHKHLKNGKAQWFLHKGKLEECLELFTPMHAPLPLDLVSSALEKYLITDLARICIGYL